MRRLQRKTRARGADRRRVRAERSGRFAEMVASLFLRAQLYRIHGARVKTPVGEIDLVAERFGTLVFVEVKGRRDNRQEEMALLAVNRHRIARAAQYYVSGNPELAVRTMRFDVIFLAPFAWPRHVKGAFES